MKQENTKTFISVFTVNVHQCHRNHQEAIYNINKDYLSLK